MTKSEKNPERASPNLKRRSENSFWSAAFLAAELPTLLKGGRRISPVGAAHIAADYADAALVEFRRRTGTAS